jgi:hypothetical protein
VLGQCSGLPCFLRSSPLSFKAYRPLARLEKERMSVLHP